MTTATNRDDRFARGSGLFTCSMCGKATRRTGDNASVRLCPACYERAMWENAHNDERHWVHPRSDCPICKEVNNVPKQ